MSALALLVRMEVGALMVLMDLYVNVDQASLERTAEVTSMNAQVTLVRTERCAGI